MRWYQVVIALLGGVLSEGMRVLLYVLDVMPYGGPYAYTLPSRPGMTLWLVAPLVVIPLVVIVLRGVGASWQRSVAVAVVAYLGGYSTYQFISSLTPLFSIGGSGSVFQNPEEQMLTLIISGMILCCGLVVRNPSYPRWTVPVLVGVCLLGYFGAVEVLPSIYSGRRWWYQLPYIITGTVYGLILVVAWRRPVEDLGTGDYTIGEDGAAPATTPERPSR